MKFILLSFFLAFSATCSLWAQSGCTDPNATNYDSTATTNNGSCAYPQTSYNPAKRATLPEALAESSGLIYTNGSLWTFNDSEGEAAIYKIDEQTGAISQTVTITNATNVDWEAITADATYLYIGDFGNNANGNRRDLTIYRVKKSQIGTKSQVNVQAEIIKFSYGDQTDFTARGSNNTTFDCEAFIHHKGQLHLFTKDWISFQTKHYTLPATPGTHTATLHGQFEANGLITDAAIAATPNQEIALVGYDTRNGGVFMWLLFGYQGIDFFNGHKRRIDMGNVLEKGQVEGITFAHENNGYISSEKLERTILGNPVLVPPGLFTFTTNDWVSQTPLSIDNSIGDPKSHLNVYPNPLQKGQNLFIQTDNPFVYSRALQLIDIHGAVVARYPVISSQGEPCIVDTQALSAGMYMLQLIDSKRPVSTKIMIY